MLIEGVMIYVKDVRQSAEFYRRQLGFAFDGYWDDTRSRNVKTWKLADPPGYAEMRTPGGHYLSLHQAGERQLAGEPPFIVYFAVPDVDAFARRIAKKGVSGNGPSDMPWGTRSLYVNDPDGYELCFSTPLGVKKGARKGAKEKVAARKKTAVTKKARAGKKTARKRARVRA